MGSAQGAAKAAAARIGVSIDEYATNLAAGMKWCTGCKAWHAINHFPADRSRGDGRRSKCLRAERGKPRTDRDPQREKARKAVGYAVRTGKLQPADSQPCTDCGHRGTDRRHEYDHYLGYGDQYWLSVEVVCTLCHADREKRRRANG